MPQDWHGEFGGPETETWQQMATLLYVAVAAGYSVRDIVVLIVIFGGVAAIRR